MSTSRSTAMPLPVHAMVARNARSRRVNSGVKSRVSTGAMFSMTLCLASTSQAAMTTAPTAPQGRIQDLQEPLRRQADGAEDEHGEHHQHAAAEGDEDVVDEPLAGEAHVVHALVVIAPARRRRTRSPRPATARWAGAGPPAPRVSTGCERHEVHGQGARDERRRQPEPGPRARAPASRRRTRPGTGGRRG